jgi:hypothetical protein
MTQTTLFFGAETAKGTVDDMNQDKFTYNGKTYIANSEGYVGCSGCALFNENCAVIQRPPCIAPKRDDGKTVNFHEVKK